MSTAVTVCFLSFLILLVLPAAPDQPPRDDDFCTTPEEEQLSMNVPKLTLASTIGKVVKRIKRSSMAWYSSGDSNQALVDNLQGNGVFSDDRVREAMLKVDRGDFAPHSPYGDHPVSIGYSATISAPHMHATSLQLLRNHLTEGAHVLDVGSGSGYLTVCMALMVGTTGKVVGIEHIRELVKLSEENTNKNHADLLTNGTVLYVVGDGRKGYEPEAPYDAIHVGAAAPRIPDELISQLAQGGRMLIPVGEAGGNQRFLQVDKDANGEVEVSDLMGVIYVPLTDRYRQVGDR